MFLLTKSSRHKDALEPRGFPACQREYYRPTLRWNILANVLGCGQWLVSVMFGIAVANDILLTTALIVVLLRRRTGFKQ